ncbi:sensor histidine kinase [Lysobacter korlensis]|uniref:Sensor histidine kinase n=1 Tax=Lysobacter korlensis TaxID=553636 RepID=A0ABV6RPI3_9GAMM
MWIAVTGCAIAAALALAPGINANRFIYFGLSLLVIQWIAGLTLGGLYLGRRVLAVRPAHQVAYLAVFLLFISTGLVGTMAWLLMQGIWPVANERLLPVLLRLLGIAAAVSVLGIAAFRNHWTARQLAVRAKQAELESLQARIRPHFLFNTLNTGAALVHQRPEEAERLLLDLADLFRAALAGPREISLEEELSLVRRYLEIESLRFGERLRVEWQLPATIPNVQVPSLSIQPLVENAIRHGVERVSHGGRVEITLTTTAEHVVVRISNPLVLSDQKQPVSHQVGLNASQARIEALTGGRGSVQTGRQGEHWVATVRLPRDLVSSDRRRRV